MGVVPCFVTQPMTPFERFVHQIHALQELGLNWFAYAAGPVSSEPHGRSGLLLALSLGTRFAEQTPYDLQTTPNPFDERAVALLEPLLVHLRTWDPRASIVYPSSSSTVNLMAWLTAARVQYSSRLGIGIRPDCGTFFAVRGAVETQLPEVARVWLAERFPPLPSAPSPCETCEQRPCQSACPAAAVTANFNLERCVSHRLEEASSCAYGCAARLACPVGAGFRYSVAQTRYHYDVSLRMLRRWKQGL